MDIQDISSATLGNNAGGIKKKVYIIKQENVQEIPAVNSAGVIDSNLTLKSGQSFKFWELTEDTGNAKYEPQGQVDSKSYKATLTFNIPKAKGEKSAQFAALKNVGVIVIYEDANGIKWLIGDLNRPAYVQATLDGGTAFSDPNFYKVEVMHENHLGAVEYQGEVLTGTQT